MAPVPDASVALWKRSVKPAPVDADPPFEMVLRSVTAVPAVAVVGVMVDAVRSGAGAALTVSALEHNTVLVKPAEVMFTPAAFVPVVLYVGVMEAVEPEIPSVPLHTYV